MVAIAIAATAIGASVVSAAPSEVRLAPILRGYERPLLVTNDGRNNRVIYVVEQQGTISRATFVNGKWKKLATFLDISHKVLMPERGQMGLLGLAFHPRYDKNGRFYVVYNRVGEGDASGDIVIAEYRRLSYARARVNSERIVAIIDATTAIHGGGNLVFGPDRLLYVGLGDGGEHEDADGNGQNLGTLLGSILRINPFDPDGAGPRTYSIPRSNPYVGKPGRDEIWANGFRNPWRFSFDAANGNLWVGEVGLGRREEIDKGASNRRGLNAGRGRNYGWSDCEGSLEFKLDEGDADGICSTHTLPLFDYTIERDNGRCSVIGGHVHRGVGSRAWRGLYIAGDYCGEIFVFDQSGNLRWARNSFKNISSFGQDSAGRMYASDILEGTIYRVQMRGPRPSR